jgi:methylmalonyl-CoA mutase
MIEDLEGGVTSIELGVADRGLTTEELGRALDGVALDVAPVALAPHADLGAAASLVELWDRAGVLPVTRGSLGLDPLGEQARNGTAAATVAECAGFVVEQLVPGPAVGMVVDLERYVDAGATEVQELAWGTATGIAYLRALVDAGLGVAEAARRIGFRWATTSEQFVTIAKLRAARRMWARVLEVSGAAAAHRAQYQQAVTPLSSYSRLDPWVNLIRGTTAALAAVVGGADSVTVSPFDRLAPRPGGLGRRAARNTQLLWLEESHVGRSADPAGGSFFVESLTERMAEAGWARLREVERTGGMAGLLASGAIGDELEKDWAARLNALGSAREALVGVNRYPDRGEVLASPGDREGSSASSGRGGLPIRRPAAPFEALRDAADRYRADTGRVAVVHLAALGAPNRSTRVDWVTNMLWVGGVEATGEDTEGTESPIALEAEFVASGSKVAVICGTDDLYETRGTAVAIALKEAGAALVAMVGDPGDRRSDLTRAGVDEFWYDGVDMLAVLGRLHTALGVDDGTR